MSNPCFLVSRTGSGSDGDESVMRLLLIAFLRCVCESGSTKVMKVMCLRRHDASIQPIFIRVEKVIFATHQSKRLESKYHLTSRNWMASFRLSSDRTSEAPFFWSFLILPVLPSCSPSDCITFHLHAFILSATLPLLALVLNTEVQNQVLHQIFTTVRCSDVDDW